MNTELVLDTETSRLLNYINVQVKLYESEDRQYDSHAHYRAGYIDALRMVKRAFIDTKEV